MMSFTSMKEFKNSFKREGAVDNKFVVSSFNSLTSKS